MLAGIGYWKSLLVFLEKHLEQNPAESGQAEAEHLFIYANCVNPDIKYQWDTNVFSHIIFSSQLRSFLGLDLSLFCLKK